MTTETLPIVVTEFLRPENSHEPVVYHVDPFVAAKVEKLNEKGVTVCVDIYGTGKCRTYIYDPINESTLYLSQRVEHSIANETLCRMVRYFDLASVS